MGRVGRHAGLVRAASAFRVFLDLVGILHLRRREDGECGAAGVCAGLLPEGVLGSDAWSGQWLVQDEKPGRQCERGWPHPRVPFLQQCPSAAEAECPGPPLPPAPGPFAARGAPSRGARRRQGRCGAAAPTPAAPRARPRGRRCGPGRAAQPPRLLRAAKRVWPRPPPWKRGAQAPTPQSRLPAPSPPTSALRAPPPARPGPWGQRQSAWVRGGGSAQRPGDGDPCSRPRSASPPSRCEKPPPAPRGASASCCCGSCCRDLPRAAGPRAQRPPPRPPRSWARVTEAPAEGVRARGEAPRSAGPWRPRTPGPWPWDVRAAEGQTPQGRCPRSPRAAPAPLAGGRLPRPAVATQAAGSRSFA